jgi:ParB family chromosome partitioning protein
MEARDIEIGRLRVRTDARPVDKDSLAALIESVREIGFTSSILVRPKVIFENGQEADGFEIIAGRHRYEVALKLGMKVMPCRVAAGLDDLRAELAMIDENMMRADLSPAELAKSTARRKEIYEALHPEASYEARPGRAGKCRQVGDNSEPTERFTAATAKATGKPERTLQRAAERGKSISEQALDKIAGTHLDRGAYLDKLKAVPKAEQERQVVHDLAAPRKPVSPAPAVRNEYESYQTFLNKVVRLFDGAPQEWRDAAIDHLQAEQPVMDRGAA